MKLIKYRFLNYEKYNNFVEDLNDGKILDDSIVFVKDKRCIWARGNEYAGGLALDYNEKTHTATLKTADGEPIVEFIDKRDYDAFKLYFGRFLEEVYVPFKDTTNATLKEHADNIELLNTDIQNEITRAIGAELSISKTIKNLEWFIEADNNGVIDKFNEIVAFLNNIEEPETLENTLASIIDAIEETVSKEESRASAAEINLQNNIDKEVVRAKLTEAELTDKITEEKDRAVGKEDELYAAIDAEAAVRSDKDLEFEQRLNKIINGVKNTINSLYAIINEKYVQRPEVFYPNDQNWTGEKDIINFDPFGILYYVYNTSLFASGISDTIGDVFVANNASVNNETLCLV